MQSPQTHIFPPKAAGTRNVSGSASVIPVGGEARGREKDASEMPLSELAMRMDLRTAEEAAAMWKVHEEKEQGRPRENSPGAGEAPQVGKLGWGEDISVI